MEKRILQILFEHHNFNDRFYNYKIVVKYYNQNQTKWFGDAQAAGNKLHQCILNHDKIEDVIIYKKRK